MDTVVDNLAASRFELAQSGHVAFADYRLATDRMLIDHVEAPAALRGSGVAGRLMQGVALAARERGLKIVPLCSYAAAWLECNPDYADVIG